MLKNLFISNYALIDHLEIEFSKGLNIITGETGAGKSVLLGALSLILGQRADVSVLSDKKNKCIIEGSFDVLDCEFETFFQENNLDFDTTVILRREIIPSGKSRAFINDTPVNLDILKNLGEKLVDIHSQHNTLTLQDSSFQLDFVDAYVQHSALLNDYQETLKKYNETNQLLQQLVCEEEKAKSDLNYYEFQFKELEDACLSVNELSELESQRDLLNHAGEINSVLSQAVSAISDCDQPILSVLKDIENSIQKISSHFPVINDSLNRIISVNIELKDIVSELVQLGNNVQSNPDRLYEIEQRLDLIYHLQQKHRVKSIEELIEVKNAFEEKILNISSLETKISALQIELLKLEQQLETFSKKLSENRKKAKKQIEKGICEVLKLLAMPDSVVEINIDSLDEYGSKGKDKINFLFNANKGGELKAISKVASGGELSRLMLAIKSLITKKQLLPTVIFDEIDTGVSGEIASKLGEILRQMSMNMQVISITHLPQIASKGIAHFFVYKETDEKSTYTRIRLLSKNERINEIARMLSGDEITNQAMENAKVLINSNKN